MLVSQREFASKAGVTEPAVSRAIKAGRLLQLAGKRINTEHPLSVEFLSRHHANGGKSAVATKQKPSRSHPNQKPAINIVAQTANVGMPADPTNQGSVDLNDRKKMADIIKTELETQIMRGRYIERELVGQWTMRWYGALSSVLRSLSGRVMPDVVSKLHPQIGDDEALRDGAKIIDDQAYEGLMLIRDAMLLFKKNVPELVALHSRYTLEAEHGSYDS